MDYSILHISYSVKHFVDAPTRAFVVVRHNSRGYLLLRAYKRKKGVHYQLPGGRIDRDDASPASAAARELFEETGVDLRRMLPRLTPILQEASWCSGRVYFMLAYVYLTSTC